MVWHFTSNGRYSVQPLYKIINFRGIQPKLVHSLWKIKIPPRVHYFLWLFSKNKVLTRDNLGKRRKVEDSTCLFCTEHESVYHLFFTCAVARQMWVVLSRTCEVQLGDSFESIGRFWLSNKRNGVVNIITSAAIWCLWKLRNDLCFQRSLWKSMDILFYQTSKTIQKWAILCPLEQKEDLLQKAMMIKREATQVLWLGWK